MHTNPGTASHLLRKFIRDYSCKGELINRLCEEFHKRIDRRKNVRTSMGAQGVSSSLQTSGLPLSDAVHCPENLNENRAQESELARIGSSTIEKRAHRSHDVLVKARLEEINRVKTALDISEQFLVFLGGRRQRIFSRRSEAPRSVCSREMQLVKSNEHGLGEIERSMFSRRNRDDDMGAIEDLIRESLVLSSEEQRHRSSSRELEDIAALAPRSSDIALCGAASSREAGDTHASLESFFDGVAVPDLLDDVARIVRDSLEAPRIVFHRADKVETTATHVFHRANCRRDVYRILGLVQYHPNEREN